MLLLHTICGFVSLQTSGAEGPKRPSVSGYGVSLHSGTHLRRESFAVSLYRVLTLYMSATMDRLSKEMSITVRFHRLRVQAVFRPPTVRTLGDVVE
jgi:hypothetical protein